jgi:hypothetical protein
MPGWHTYPEMGAGASMWATPSDLARFAIKVMQAYTGQTDEALSHGMAIQMLTPQIDDRGLGPVAQDDGGDRFYFMHPGRQRGLQVRLGRLSAARARRPAEGDGMLRNWETARAYL